MRCALGCLETKNPAVGMANLKGRPDGLMPDYRNVLALCAYHYNQIKAGEWGNVTMEGWESFPDLAPPPPIKPPKADETALETADDDGMAQALEVDDG